MPKNKVCCPADQLVLDRVESLLGTRGEFNSLMKAAGTTKVKPPHIIADLDQDELAYLVLEVVDHMVERVEDELKNRAAQYLMEAAGISRDLAEHLLNDAAKVRDDRSLGELLKAVLRPQPKPNLQA